MESTHSNSQFLLFVIGLVLFQISNNNVSATNFSNILLIVVDNMRPSLSSYVDGESMWYDKIEKIFYLQDFNTF